MYIRSYSCLLLLKDDLSTSRTKEIITKGMQVANEKDIKHLLISATKGINMDLLFENVVRLYSMFHAVMFNYNLEITNTQIVM